MSECEKIHFLTEAIYKNVLENFNPGVKQLLTTGRAYQKAIHNMTTASKAYIDCIYTLAQSAQVCKGATSDIGSALLQVAEVHKEINTQVVDNIKSFHAELLIPMDAKQDSEIKQIQLQYKKYMTGHKYYMSPYDKAQSCLKKHKKKAKNRFGFDQKEMQYTREVKDCHAKLEDYHLQNLRQALLEERKRYCFLLDRVCAMVRNYASHHSQAQEMLTHRLSEWSTVCKNPHSLPDSSEAVIRAFRSTQEDVYNTPEEVDSLRRDNSCSDSFEQQAQDNNSITYGTSHRMGDGPDNSSMSYGTVPNGMVNINDDYAVAGMMHKSITIPAPPLQARQQVRAMYSHNSSGENQLSFAEGDVISLIGDKRDGWQYGENNRTHRMGWFPISFTEHIPVTPSSAPSGFGHQRVKSLGNLVEFGSSNQDFHHNPGHHNHNHHHNMVHSSGHSDSDSVQAPLRDHHDHRIAVDRPTSMYAGHSHYASNHSKLQAKSIPDVSLMTPRETPHQQNYHFNQPPLPSPELPPPPPPDHPPPGSARGQVSSEGQQRPPPLNHAISSPAVIKTPTHIPRPVYESHAQPTQHATTPHSHPDYITHGQLSHSAISQGPGVNGSDSRAIYSSPSPSPANSSSGYSGSTASGRPSYGTPHGLHGNPHVGFPPPPPNLAPPQPPTSDYEEDGPNRGGNPFSSIKLKRTVTDDRSAPRIY